LDLLRGHDALDFDARVAAYRSGNPGLATR
jgi:hypothetical protein